MIPEHLLKEHWPEGCPFFAEPIDCATGRALEKEFLAPFMFGTGELTMSTLGSDLEALCVGCCVAICWHERQARLAEIEYHEKYPEIPFGPTNPERAKLHIRCKNSNLKHLSSAAAWREYLDTLWPVDSGETGREVGK